MILPESTQIDLLDDAHRSALERAVSNILSLETTEDTLAQILDGLPTPDGMKGTYGGVPQSHPVYKLQHNTICDGFMEQVRAMRSEFAVSKIVFKNWVRIMKLLFFLPSFTRPALI